ncbi:hypothetical protein A3A46_03710 [Candidatus Roizmanbacteria bacterium RIFCSPLOWO2_01_FULL_37_13]|uniref:Uncharacterized protein n=1 Tax=Candidatus Roizmanbacteria bacterium RIFCSPHIGHO2_02_FULL_38_11 TaxID=1802039 RepID=A0A1F7H2I7_9BACT|nr:MAG: hypothetical protein A3C25_00495 [Candidatus Roizmanbacteria bacterium RIFCSPHIGHO2_02_FULL_38_11]OGK34241.1 MAG: hypothetical protein A3F58_01445 [Candidatus Roizmanbacteria bacterium RIFCSPHIGHO2_12_FULL_37_9b]OGK41029.1 MAG: hypothetical protein A3A46_03710 [Candidatus Roizmanbacteria bacterium RIFCSPLOWO2_01_FULL_37_13]
MTYLSRSDIKINVKILNSGNLIARATVILFDVWEIHGWRIMKSTKMHPNFGENLWIQAPCYKTTKGWKEIVYINDRKTYDLVHEMIYDAYHMARSKKEGLESIDTKESSKEKQNLEVKNENINPDDIPI